MADSSCHQHGYARAVGMVSRVSVASCLVLLTLRWHHDDGWFVGSRMFGSFSCR